jgi:hypothetical protein
MKKFNRTWFHMTICRHDFLFAAKFKLDIKRYMITCSQHAEIALLITNMMPYLVFDTILSKVYSVWLFDMLQPKVFRRNIGKSFNNFFSVLFMGGNSELNITVWFIYMLHMWQMKHTFKLFMPFNFKENNIW